jgi:glyoxylase-like metal-dependent hydrolase (beta-lactamase superfamily II)
MYIEQMYTNCLAQAAYYLESNGEVAIIDPIRDYQVYINKAAEKNHTIKYIFETHFHADFVSGHIDLAKVTGAKIIYGPEAVTGFESYIAKDGEIFNLGTSEKYTNLELAKIILKLGGHTQDDIEFVVDRKGHDFRYSLDFTKAQDQLGFSHQGSFSLAILQMFSSEV